MEKRLKDSQLKILFSASLVMFATIWPGCKKDSNPVAPEPAVEIVPLKVGNSWTHNQTNFDTSGAVIASGEVAYSITKDTIIEGTTLFEFQTDKILSPTGGGHMYGLPAKGVPRRNTDNGLVQRPRCCGEPLVYKYPTTVGELYDSRGFSVRVANVDPMVQVPAGTFRCIRYEFSQYGLRLFDVYVSPGIGEIKSVSYFGNNPFSKKDSVSSTTVLTHFSLK